MPKNKKTGPIKIGPPVSGFTYFLYMLYVISFFLHLSSRIPGIAAVRPDLLLVLLIAVLLFLQSERLKNRVVGPCSDILKVLLIYIAVTLPFVEWPGSVINSHISQFVKAICFFYFTVLIVDTKDRMKLFISIFILCQVFRVLEPLYLNITEGYWGDDTYLKGTGMVDRLSGAPHDIINPNGLGFVIATAFAYLHYVWGDNNWKYKLSYVAVAPALLYALVLTMSRSGFVALAVVAWNVFLKSKHRFVLIIIGLFACVVLWANMNDAQRDRYLSLTGSEKSQSHGTAAGRMKGIVKGLEVGMKRPIVGHGLGTSKEANYNVLHSALISHILYFEVLIELGTIGFYNLYAVFEIYLYCTTKHFQAIERIQ